MCHTHRPGGPIIQYPHLTEIRPPLLPEMILLPKFGPMCTYMDGEVTHTQWINPLRPFFSHFLRFCYVLPIFYWVVLDKKAHLAATKGQLAVICGSWRECQSSSLIIHEMMAAWTGSCWKRLRGLSAERAQRRGYKTGLMHHSENEQAYIGCQVC